MIFSPTVDIIGTGYDYDENGKFLGVTYTLPKVPDEKEIEGYQLASAKQKFKRIIFPTDREIKDYSEESKLEIIKRELNRRINGYWFYNNGVPTYITGSHYFYLNYWYMGAETFDGYPEYRWAGTKWAYFMDYCDKDPDCLGGIMLCNKRFGKTEYSISDLYNSATLLDNERDFGMQSINSTEAKNNLFKRRLMRSHKRIPNYLKPYSNETNATKPIMSELRFEAEKDSDGNYKDALNNTIDWRPTIVSAYQGKKPRKVIVDESGTIDEMDLEEWRSTLREQLLVGNKVIGKMYLPTTLENMTNKGAIAYQDIWNRSDYNKRDANNHTETGLYRYFKSFDEGREGFMDEYGNDKKEEAQKYRENFLATATLEAQRKYKRQYPATEAEAFDTVKADKYDADVIEIIEAMILEAEKLNLPSRKIRFINDPKEGLKTATSNRDAMIMYEDVKPGIQYLQVTDGVKTGTETGGKQGSSVCSLIIKLFEPDGGCDYPSYSVVCIYFERPKTKDNGYDNIIDQFDYYNKFKGMKKIAAEGNDDSDTFSSRLKKEGKWSYIDYAKDLSGRGSINTKKPFQYIDINAKNFQYYWACRHIKKYPHCIRSCIPLMRQMLATGNADIESAWLMCIIHFYPELDMTKKEKKATYIEKRELIFDEFLGYVEKVTKIGGDENFTPIL